MSLSSDQRNLLAEYSTGRASAIDVRRALGGVTYGELLIMLAGEGLSFPVMPVAGREAQLEKARLWLFPKQSRAA